MNRRRARVTEERRLLTGPIHERIFELRTKRELTQQQLADLIGVDKTTVSAWERRLSRPDMRYLAALARALRVSIETLIRGEELAA